jgi:DnaJ domain
MPYLVTGAITLGILFVLAQGFASADPRRLVRAIRYGVGGVLLAIGVLLILAERIALGGVLVAAGLSAIATGRLGPFDLGGGVRRAAGSDSTVRSAWFEMRLDHDSGAMNGRVLRGEFAGRSLDGLDEDQLMKLAVAVAGNGDSAALLEAYLDRRIPGWRENVEGDGAARTGGAADAGPMTDKQAYEILGLLPGATEAEIRAAHRRLMKAVHPDQGGSTFLAAKINQAKDRLLGTHR